MFINVDEKILNTVSCSQFQINTDFTHWFTRSARLPSVSPKAFCNFQRILCMHGLTCAETTRRLCLDTVDLKRSSKVSWSYSIFSSNLMKFELLSCSKSLTISASLLYHGLNTVLFDANWSFLIIERPCHFYHSISVSRQDIHILIAMCIYSIYLIYLIHGCTDVRDIPGKRATSVTQEAETWQEDRKNRWAPEL